MAFNGSGLFVRLYNWVTDKANSIPITASRMDGEMDGFAAGLSNCVTRDGQGQPAANLAPGSDATYDLGTALVRWRNLYLSGGFTTPINVNGFITENGATGSVTSGSTNNLHTFPTISGQIVYLVSAAIAASNDAPNYNVTALVSTNNTTAKLTILQSAPLMTLSLNGLILQAVQGSGANAVITWTLARVQ